MRGERPRRRRDEAQVRIAVAGEGGRDADQDRVGGRELGDLGRRLEALVAHGADRLVGDRLDVGAAAVKAFGLCRVDVEADDPLTGLDECARKRQPDIAESDDADHGLLP